MKRRLVGIVINAKKELDVCVFLNLHNGLLIGQSKSLFMNSARNAIRKDYAGAVVVRLN